MGLFNRKSKNVENDNGENFIYFDTSKGKGRGELKYKFNKINGELNGEFFVYNHPDDIKKGAPKLKYIKNYKNGVRRQNEWDIAAQHHILKLHKLVECFWEYEKLFGLIFKDFNIINLSDPDLDLVSQFITNHFSHKINLSKNNVMLFLKYKRNFLANYFIQANNYDEKKMFISFANHLRDNKLTYNKLRNLKYKDEIDEYGVIRNIYFINREFDEVWDDIDWKLNYDWIKFPIFERTESTTKYRVLDYDVFVEDLNSTKFLLTNCTREGMILLKKEVTAMRERLREPDWNSFDRDTTSIILDNKKGKKEIDYNKKQIIKSLMKKS